MLRGCLGIALRVVAASMSCKRWFHGPTLKIVSLFPGAKGPDVLVPKLQGEPLAQLKMRFELVSTNHRRLTHRRICDQAIVGNDRFTC